MKIMWHNTLLHHQRYRRYGQRCSSNSRPIFRSLVDAPAARIARHYTERHVGWLDLLDRHR